MKPKSLTLVTLLSILSMGGLSAAPATSDGRTEVNFLEPEKFTDVRDSHTGDPARTTYLAQLREHLVNQARHYVPAGYSLSVTFTDVDMAGDFEPWRGPQWSDVRVVKDIYPPRINLVFRLTDPEGNVVKEGKRELRDLAFMMKISIPRDDAVKHEKALLDDWLRSEFPRPRKS